MDYKTLLNTEITIIITNDGKENTINISTNQDNLVRDTLFAIKMAENTMSEVLKNYADKKQNGKKLTDKVSEKLFNTLTLKQLNVG